MGKRFSMCSDPLSSSRFNVRVFASKDCSSSSLEHIYAAHSLRAPVACEVGNAQRAKTP